MAGMARTSAFWASSKFFDSVAFKTLFEKVLMVDLTAALRTRLFSL